MAYIFPKVINVSNKQVVLLSAKAGFAIGCYFEGVGAFPGTIIGGAIGGIAGAYGGSWFGTETVDFIYGW